MFQIFSGIGNMLIIVVIVMLLVLVAMMIDLASGIHKAKLRKEFIRSEVLKRTLTKFISYEGGLSIAAMVDALIHMAGLFPLIGLSVLHNIPIVAILVGIFLLAVEFMSVNEKADEKTKRQQKETLDLIASVLSKDDLKEIIHRMEDREPSDDTQEKEVEE